MAIAVIVTSDGRTNNASLRRRCFRQLSESRVNGTFNWGDRYSAHRFFQRYGLFLVSNLEMCLPLLRRYLPGAVPSLPQNTLTLNVRYFLGFSRTDLTSSRVSISI